MTSMHKVCIKNTGVGRRMICLAVVYLGVASGGQSRGRGSPAGSVTYVARRRKCDYLFFRAPWGGGGAVCSLPCTPLYMLVIVSGDMPHCVYPLTIDNAPCLSQ